MDKADLNAIADKYMDSVYRVAINYCKNADDAADAVQNEYLYGELSYRPDSEFVENHVMKCEYAGEYDIISMEEAYKKITEGKFGRRNENIDRKEDRLDIEITECELIYELDSKGYLQPDYEFSCMINGRENKIIIPALR